MELEEFEWDQAKAESNLLKHKIPFPLAAQYYTNGEGAVDVSEEKNGELRNIRYITWQDRLFVIVWTKRGNKIRLISARKGNQRELRHYRQLHSSASSAPRGDGLGSL